MLDKQFPIFVRDFCGMLHSDLRQPFLGTRISTADTSLVMFNVFSSLRAYITPIIRSLSQETDNG